MRTHQQQAKGWMQVAGFCNGRWHSKWGLDIPNILPTLPQPSP